MSGNDPRLIRVRGRLWWEFPDGRRLPRLAGATTFTLTQSGFRGRNDDGSEAAATWKAAANTNWDQPYDQVFRVRFTVQANNTTGTVVPQLQYNRNNAGFNNVTGASTVVRATASPNIADGVATTKQLAGTGTFAAGSIDEVDGLCANVTLASNGNTEVEYSILIRSQDVAASDTIVLRVVGQATAGTVFGGTYTSPTVTVVGPQLTDSGSADDSLRVAVAVPLPDGASAADQLAPPPEPPQNVTGLRLWLAARRETGLTGGAGVATPTNWSGLGNDLTQATGTKQPTYETAVIDGQPVFRFAVAAAQEWTATTGNILSISNAASGMTVFAVVKVAAFAGVTQEFINFDTNSTGTARLKWGYRFVSGSPDDWYAVGRRLDADAQTTSDSGVAVDTNWHLHTLTPDWANGQISFYREQTLDSTVGWTSTGTVSATNSFRVAVGSKGGSEYLDGDLAEVLVYDRVLNATDRQTVWTYLLGVYPSLAGVTPITLADVGQGAGALQVAAAVPLADAGITVDSLQVAAQVTLGDQATAADSLTVVVSRTLPDSGTSADLLQVTTAAALADVGQAADALTSAAAVPLPDGGAAADTLQVAVQVSLADTAAAADSLTVGQFEPKTLGDSGAAADLLVGGPPGLGLRLFLDADADTASGSGSVSAAPDRSGAGNHAGQATGTKQPTRVTGAMNGNAVYRFDGTADTLALTTSGWLAMTNAASGITVFAVAKKNTVGSVAAHTLSISIGGGSANRFSLVQRLNNFQVGGRRLDTDAFAFADGGPADTNWNVHGGVLDWANSDAFLYLNGVLVGSNTSFQAAGTTSATDALASSVGSATQGTSEYWDGDIAVVLAYNRALSSGEIQQAHEYLLGRFGITASASKTLADSSTGGDAVQVGAQILLADAGIGTDLLRPAAAVSLVDQGTGTDTFTASVAAATVEIGAIRWVTPAGATPKTLADSGTAAEQLKATAAAPLPDSASAAEQLRPTAQVTLPDSTQTPAADQAAVAAQVTLGDQAIAAESMTLLQGIPQTLADSAAAADQLTVTVQVALAEQGTAADQLQVVAQVPLAQQGTAADSLTVGQFEPKTLTDSGAAADQVTVAAAAALTDQGLAADQISSTAAVLLTQAGTGVDVLQTTQAGAPTLFDQGVAADTLQPSAQVLLGDGAAAADSLTVGQTHPLTDSATAADSVQVAQFIPQTLLDSATATDQVLAAAAVPLPDQGIGVETLLPVVAASLTDSGQAADSLVAAGIGDQKTLTDSAAAAESLIVTQAKLLTDQAAGSDQPTVNVGRVLTDQGLAADLLRPTALAVLPEQATAADVLALSAVAALRDSGTATDTMVVLTVAYWIRTSSQEPAATTVSKELAGTSESREPALATSSREKGTL